MDSKKQNKQTKQKETHRYREETDDCQMEERFEGMDEKN